jgi:hypothetical protein
VYAVNIQCPAMRRQTPANQKEAPMRATPKIPAGYHRSWFPLALAREVPAGG